MEQINRIELRGNVGNVRISEVGGNKVANFSLATNYTYVDRNGAGVVETTWHNVVAWDNKGMPQLERITKGCLVYVCGRLKSSKYTGNDGSEKQIYEVIASKVELLNTPASKQGSQGRQENQE